MNEELDERVKLSVDQALVMLAVQDGRVHTILNPSPNMLVGADWPVERVRECFVAHGVELSGTTATEMKHAVASKVDGRWVFFATREGAVAEVAS